MSTRPTIEELITTGTDLLLQYGRTPRDTALLRKIAETFVDLRAQCVHRATGSPDWQGRSQQYREAVSAIFDGAGIPQARRRGLTATLSYHYGAVLRERLTPAELEAAGIQVTQAQKKQWAERATAPMDFVLEVAKIVDDTYTPEGVAIWWANFAGKDADGRRAMVQDILRWADGVFV